MHRKLRSTTALIFLFMLLISGRAEAFDYPEHAHLSHESIQLALVEDRDAQAVFDAVAPTLNGTNLCAGPLLYADAPAACFALSDIPALSGDHAASPLLVKWRWFNDCLAPNDPEGALSIAARVMLGLGRGDQSPETALLRAPRPPLMLALIRRYAPSKWPLATPPGDIDFLGPDDAYVTLGERGRPHFRPGLTAPTLELARERRSGDGVKPADQAFAWYADLHAGAVTYAQHSATRHGREDQTFFRGVSMLLELTALHYLEDSVASGHMVADRSMENGPRMANHDRYCKAGVVARPGRELCAFVGKVTVNAAANSRREPLPALARACSTSPPSPVRLYGDHQLSNQPASNESVTRDWAVAVSAASLLEVIAAARQPLDETTAAILNQCQAEVVDESNNYTWTAGRGACGSASDRRPGPDQRLYRCIYRWWESGKPAVERRARITSVIGADFPASALGMLPTPLTGDGSIESGPTGDELGTDIRSVDLARKTYPTYEFFSGGARDIQQVWSYSIEHKTLQPGITLGARLVIPRNVAPVEVALDGSFFFDDGVRSVDALLDFRVLLESRLFLELNGRAGTARCEDRVYRARLGGAGGFGFIPVSRNRWQLTIFLNAGGGGITGPTLQSGAGINFF